MNKNQLITIVLLIATLFVSCLLLVDQEKTNDNLESIIESLDWEIANLRVEIIDWRNYATELVGDNQILRNENITLTIENEKHRDSRYMYLGEFMISHFCRCVECRQDWSDGITKMETPVKEGYTVAVDPDLIPLGSKLYIEDYGYRVAEDIGGDIKQNRIDVYIEDHDRALELGIVYKHVWMEVSND